MFLTEHKYSADIVRGTGTGTGTGIETSAVASVPLTVETIVTTEGEETASARVTEPRIEIETDLLKIGAGEVVTAAGTESTETGETSPVIEVKDAKVLLTPPPVADEVTAVTVIVAK